MKRIILSLVAMLAISAYAQKVDVRIDEFTEEKIITTEWVKIYGGGATGKNQTRARFRHENGKDYLEFRIYTNRVTSMLKDSKVLLKTTDGMVTLYNIENTLAEPGAWHPSGINDNLGIYIICDGEMDELKNKAVTKMRFYFRDGYSDIDIKGDAINKLYNAFINHK